MPLSALFLHTSADPRVSENVSGESLLAASDWVKINGEHKLWLEHSWSMIHRPRRELPGVMSSLLPDLRAGQAKN